jgi:carbon storage regulator
MLVLQRKRNESIILTGPDGTRSKITIVEVDRGRVRVGIEAPNSVKVHRDEVQEMIDAGSPEKAR